ncbi:YwqG family protein [Mangrovibacterium lignilyticum]|uniref:YwqG family protein n=1 Tax=Mangrovibacterium lignilyticum TaxID=2668052 RepID=UPI0013D60EA5|nr:YwqG family protein [Mangrovibacterium lignilyticum]
MSTILWISLTILVVFGLLNRNSLFKKSSNNQINNQVAIESDTNDILTSAELKNRFAKLGLGEHWDKFESLLRNEIRIITSISDSENLELGQSKIGGQPDLPLEVDWFKENNDKPLSFIAQINLSEIHPFDKDNLLPDRGIIYFFYSAEQEAWGFDPKDKDKFKVYCSTETDNLTRREFPSDLPDYSRFNECKLDIKTTVGLPSWENEFVQKNLSEKEIDQYLNLPQDYAINKMLGYSNNIQSEMELECQLVTNGLYCGDPSGYNDPKAKGLEKGTKDWILLLQIDSEDEKTGMMWGDVGRLYFWIKKEDLKNKDYSKTWMILQCS